MGKKEILTHAFLENSLLLENLQGGIVYSDFEPPFHLRYVTEGLARMSGYTQEELLTMKQMDIVMDEDEEMLSNEVARQFAKGDTFEIEYRLKCKDGSFIYVLDRAKIVQHDDGQKYIHCMMTDITDLKKMEIALRLSEEKYKLAMKQSGNVILEYDVDAKTVHFSENFSELFGMEIPDNASIEDLLEPEFIPVVEGLIKKATISREASSTELYVLDDDGNQIYCVLHIAPVVTDERVHAIVGCLQNIDSMKRELNLLTERSQKDGLTGIYNRITMDEKITECLAKQGGALMIMDIDNFKEVNDCYGHDVGDTVLIQVSRTIEKLLPQNALFGRLGGDEFLIFIPAIDEENGFVLASKIVNTMHSSFIDERYKVSVSVGVALANEEFHNFQQIYRNADRALYETKNKGRNGFSIFHSTKE